MYRNKKRENRYFSYIFNPLSTTQTLNGNDIEDFAGQDWVIKTPRAQTSQLTIQHLFSSLLPTSCRIFLIITVLFSSC